MQSVELNTNWNVTVRGEQSACGLPYDATANATRDYALAFGEYNGYIPAEKATFARTLPQIKSGMTELVIDGARGYGEVFVNDESVGRIDGAFCRFYGFDLSGAHNTLRIELFTCTEMSDKYMGLGVAGGVKLNVFDTDFDVANVFVKTAEQSGRTYADVETELYNNSDSPRKFVLECLAQNARGKRAGKKQRKITLRAGQHKTVDMRVRINNPYEWSLSDPYMYNMTVRMIADEETHSATARFGIVSRTLSRSRGLYVNGRRTKLYGAYVSHADAVLGAVSVYSNEKRRLSALKDIGYNAVHFVGMPTAAALDACDDVGMYAYVDLFAHLGTAKTPLGVVVSDDWHEVAEKIYALRNHPSVTVYGVADDIPECYDRNCGHEKICAVADEIRLADPTRPVTVSVREQVPTQFELEVAGCKHTRFADDGAAVNAGREKNLFENLTEGAFDSVDVCGLNYLYPLYDYYSGRGKLVLGCRTSPDKAYENIDVTDKNDRVIGDFSDCGIDYPGGGKTGEIYTTSGDVDAIGCGKPQSVYKRVIFGRRGIAYISPRDPETGMPTHTWNWPRYLGQKIDVDVYTSGDVVALYSDGRIVGRKLAGRVNKHVASFKVDYYPGTLEAVAYYRGVECARTTLASCGTPKLIRLSAFEKNLSVSRNDYGFVYIEVCDKEGRLVPYAMRQITATVTGGTLVGLTNADPLLRKNAFDECPVYGGRALAAIKPDPAEVKTVVKIAGDGLLASRISFKIKN